MRSWLKPCLVKGLDTPDAAWLAGFFDGEGSVGWYKGGRNRKYPLALLRIPNTHLPALERCREVTGTGSIIAQRIRTGSKSMWAWQVHSQRDIVSILRQMLPYLTVKATSAQEFLNRFKDLGE